MFFEFGAFGPLNVRLEKVRLGVQKPLRVLYASDLHLGHWWTSRVPGRLIEVARASCPDVILLGGDLVDTVAALPCLTQLITTLTGIAPVHAVPGNHDSRLGTSRVRDAVQSAGGKWLPDESATTPVWIDGTVTIGGLRPRILCAHYPAVFPAAVEAGYDLVFAGHLHGGQFVLSGSSGKQFPAAWFNPWHGLRFENGGAVMLVSRGAADTFPFRVNCPQEVILCEVT